MTTAEFALASPPASDRRSPVRWLGGHVRRQWPLVLGMLIGAFGNAALAAAVPVFIGQAVNRIAGVPPDLAALRSIAVWIAVTQVVRGVLQLGRNFGSEVIGQRLERDTRDELYASLIGKSMTFHDQQSVGDVMARATNDVREINLMLNPGVNLVVGSFKFLVMPILIAPRTILRRAGAGAFHPGIRPFALQRYLRNLRPTTDSVRRQFGNMNATSRKTSRASKR